MHIYVDDQCHMIAGCSSNFLSRAPVDFFCSFVRNKSFYVFGNTSGILWQSVNGRYFSNQWKVHVAKSNVESTRQTQMHCKISYSGYKLIGRLAKG